MSSQIEELVKKGAKIKRSKTKSILVVAWMILVCGLVDYMINKIGAPGSWFKDALHGLFFICLSVLLFVEYYALKQKKLNLELIERIQELEWKLSKSNSCPG